MTALHRPQPLTDDRVRAGAASRLALPIYSLRRRKETGSEEHGTQADGRTHGSRDVDRVQRGSVAIECSTREGCHRTGHGLLRVYSVEKHVNVRAFVRSEHKADRENAAA